VKLVGRLSDVEMSAFDARMAQIGGLLGYSIDHAKNARYERYWRYLCFLRNGYKGLCFSVSEDQERGRLSVSGEYPRDQDGHDGLSYGDQVPKISVSLSKRNEQIAAEIRRRFLADYDVIFEKAKARVDSSNEWHRKRREQIETVATYLGVKMPEKDGQGLYLNQWGVYRIEPHSDNAVKFEVQVDAKKAIEVFEVLRRGDES
jgi:hypothetical protein